MIIVNHVVAILAKMGYFGVFAIMAIESTCLPVIIPSELFLISYGAAAYKGNTSVVLVIFAATLGVIAGSFINYYMSAWLGRTILYKYGKYILLPPKKIQHWEKQFLKYSKYIIFFGRFVPIPAVKHIVTIPAGLSRMNIKIFGSLTALGGLIFSTMVVCFGYWFGKKVNIEENYNDFASKVVIITLLFILIPGFGYKIYDWFHRKKHKTSRA